MCEYRGCQAIAAIDELTREHTGAMRHIRAARQAITGDDRSAAAEQAQLLLDLLAPHTAVEELALLPAMAGEHPEHIEVLHREHELVHAALASIALEQTSPDGWRDQLTRALDVLRDHILKEQDGLSPAALISLNGSDWELLDEARARVGSVLAPRVTA